ncbi:MAG TPA: hypothetical protein VF690_07380 [Hymenobacter sp.]
MKWQYAFVNMYSNCITAVAPDARKLLIVGELESRKIALLQHYVVAFPLAIEAQQRL